jgi:hypothetical protein
MERHNCRRMVATPVGMVHCPYQMRVPICKLDVLRNESGISFDMPGRETPACELTIVQMPVQNNAIENRLLIIAIHLFENLNSEER